MTTQDEINKMIDDSIKAKTENAIEDIKKSYKEDCKKMNKALTIINDNLVYKIINGVYVLATPEMLYNDYVNPKDDYCDKLGITFNDNYEYRPSNGMFKVNGEIYYGVRFLLNNYQKDIDDFKNKLNYYKDKIIEIQDDYKNMINQLPKIKQLMQEYNDNIENKKYDGE